MIVRLGQMNDLQIKYFLSVARNLSFTKTAEELSVSQPAVSRHVSAMEKELGVALFDRTNKSIFLTEAGKLYYEFFSDLQVRYRLIRERAQDVNRQRSGRIRLGCLEGWDISGFFPAILEKFKQDYPNVEILLECFGTRGLVQALKNDSIDAAMSIDVTLADIEYTHVEELTSIPRIILFSSKHKLAKKVDLCPKDFENELFFALSSEEATYAANLVREYMRPFGFEPRIQVVRNIESMNACVHNGMGVAVTDWWSTAKGMSDFGFIPIGSRHPIVMVWKEKNDNPALSVLANEFKFILADQLDM